MLASSIAAGCSIHYLGRLVSKCANEPLIQIVKMFISMVVYDGILYTADIMFCDKVFCLIRAACSNFKYRGSSIATLNHTQSIPTEYT